MGRKTRNEPEPKYFYHGKALTVKELLPYSEVALSTLYSRLKANWDVERALRMDSELDPKWEGKNLLIVFTSTINQVKQSMQPVLGKKYIAYASKPTTSQKARHFFFVWLDNGKKLIVYPGEFHILGEAPQGEESAYV